MHKFVFFNRQFLPNLDSKISAISSAALYGKGVFTTLAIRGKEPFLLSRHWRRLVKDAGRIEINLTEFSEEFLTAALAGLIEKNEIETGRARITFFDEGASRIWNFGTENKTSLLITTAERREIPAELRLTVSPFPVNSASPLAGVKSCNYLEIRLALEDAKKRGFDEAIRLNEKNEVVSASTANIFWIKNEQIFTPALETGCLAGTTRSLIIENFQIYQVKKTVNELVEADEIFLTSSAVGIRPAVFENSRKRPFTITSELRKTLNL